MRDKSQVDIPPSRQDSVVGTFFVDRVPKVAVCYFVLSRPDDPGVIYWAKGTDWKSVLAEAYENLSAREIINKAA